MKGARAGVLLAACAATVGFLPMAASASTSSTLIPTSEAWYQPNPSCAAQCITLGTLPAPPPAAPPTSPFPAGTMHIGWSAGQETARSYLGLPLSGLVGQTVTAATLTVPLDAAQQDGSTSPDTAKAQVCLVSAQVAPAEGSIDAPPSANCGSHADLKYVATPAPHLEADLGALLSGLSSASALALLPDSTKNAQTDNWRLVFSSHTRTDTAKTAPASLAVTVEDPPPFDEPTTPPVVTLPGPQNPGLGNVAPPTGTGFAAPPPVDTPIVSGPTQAPVTQPVTQPVAQPQTVTVGYAYPVVWLLPLAFLVLVPLAARAITKDLTPPLSLSSPLS